MQVDNYNFLALGMMYVLNLVVGSYTSNSLLPMHHDTMFNALLGDAQVVSDIISSVNEKHPESIVENKLILTFNIDRGLDKEEFLHAMRYCFASQTQVIPKEGDIVIMLLHAHAGIGLINNKPVYQLSIGQSKYITAQDIFSCILHYLKACPVFVLFNTCAADTQIIKQNILENLIDNSRTETPNKNNQHASQRPLHFPVVLFGFSSNTLSFQANAPQPLTTSGAFLKTYFSFPKILSLQRVYDDYVLWLKKESNSVENNCYLNLIPSKNLIKDSELLHKVIHLG